MYKFKIKEIFFDEIQDIKLYPIWQYPNFEARMIVFFEDDFIPSSLTNSFILNAAKYHFLRDELNATIGPDSWKYSFHGTGIYLESKYHLIQYQLSRNF